MTIAHEAMPGFMGAMVMPFLIRDKAVLDDVRPGDVVHGPMVVDVSRRQRQGLRTHRPDRDRDRAASRRSRPPRRGSQPLAAQVATSSPT